MVLEFDEATSSRLEKMYHARDMLERRRRVRLAVAATAGEHVLDVGCGPGFYVRDLLDDVGPTGAVVGVDASESMLELARRRCEGHRNAELLLGEASGPPVPDEAFDAVLCVQVLEYVPDPTEALSAMLRALRPGGRIVVWDTDWATVSWHSREPARMQRVLRVWDEHLRHASLPSSLATRMRDAGFEGVTFVPHTFATEDASADSFGGFVFRLVKDFLEGNQGISQEEADAWAAEQDELAASGQFFFAATQFCFTGRRPAAQD